MTVAEFMFSLQALEAVVRRRRHALLREAGTRWITGGGAEVLEDGFRRRHSPGKFTVSDYFTAQRAILDAGLGSAARRWSSVSAETLDERLSTSRGCAPFRTKRAAG